MSAPTRLVTVLAVCAASDLAAVPMLLSGDDRPPAAIGVLVGVLGLLTAVAAVGVARGRHHARTLAAATRVIDLASAAPAIGVGGAAAGAAVVTVVLSVLALVALTLTRATAGKHLPAL